MRKIFGYVNYPDIRVDISNDSIDEHNRSVDSSNKCITTYFVSNNDIDA